MNNKTKMKAFDFIKVYLILLFLAPFLVCCIVNIFTMPGERFNLLIIFSMMLFVYITLPIWCTYIAYLAFVPLVFEDLAKKIEFVAIPIIRFRILYSFYGALTGILVISPLIVLSSSSIDMMLVWLAAGAFSGAISISLVANIYRKRMLMN